MAVLIVHRGTGPWAYGGTDDHPHVQLIPEDPALPTVTLPVAPLALPNEGLAAAYTRIDTPGRMPVMVRSGEPLHRINLDVTLVKRPRIDQEVETVLQRLRFLARSTSRVRMTYGPSEQGWWWITDLSWTVEDRKAYTNEIGSATARIELTRATGGPPIPAQQPVRAALAGPSTGRAPTPTATRTRPRSYTWAAGDTLSSVALRFYADARRWRDIATRNRITDPRVLRPGRVVLLP
jgi:hypothetical protein